MPFIWKGLTIEDFAVIGIIDASTPFIATILCLSSDQYLTRFYFTWNAGERRLRIGQNLSLNTISIGALGLGCLLLFLTISRILNLNDFEYYLYGLIHVIFYSAFAFPNSLFRITNNSSRYIIFTLSLFSTRLLMNYVFTISMGLGLEGYIISNTINSFLFFLIIYWYLFTKFPFSVDKLFYNQILKFTLPFIPTNLANNASSLSDRIVLSIYGGKFEVGLLTVAQKIASAVGSLSQAIKLAYVPYISEFISKERYSTHTLNRSRMLFLTPVSIVSLFLILFGVDILHLLGMNIHHAGKYLYLFILIVYLNSNNLFFSPGLYLSKRSDKMWIPNVFQLLLRFVLYFVFVPTYLLKGVLMVSVVASLASFAYNYYLSEKYFRLNLKAGAMLVQFLPFLIPITLSIFGKAVFDLNLLSRGLMMGLYILILWFFLINKYDGHHTQVA